MAVLSSKVALVTGGARGIGRACALKLARAGCDVVINYYNSSDKAAVLAKEIEALGQKALTVQANVADKASVKEMMQAIQLEFGRLDIIISNAASGVLKPTLEMSLKHWRWCMETNAYALQCVVQQAASLLQDHARVIAISSLGASRAIPNYGFIGASKAALEAVVRGLSIELAEKHTTVNTVSAGVVDTDALKYFPNREQILEDYRAHSLTDRDLLPSDVADAVYLMCLPEAQMITGQVIYVDSGYNITG